jgi:hypothetical protein
VVQRLLYIKHFHTIRVLLKLTCDFLLTVCSLTTTAHGDECETLLHEWPAGINWTIAYGDITHTGYTRLFYYTPGMIAVNAVVVNHKHSDGCFYYRAINHKALIGETIVRLKIYNSGKLLFRRMVIMKRNLRKCIIAAAFAAYPLYAFAQSDSEDTTAEPLKAPAASLTPGEATIAPILALKQPSALLRNPDQMVATSLAPAPQSLIAPFRPTMGTGAYLAAKVASERFPATGRPEAFAPLAPPALKLSIEGVNQGTAGGSFPPDSEGSTGINHFVEITNSHVDIFLKSNGARVKSVSLASFLGYFTQGVFDPRVIYDSTWNRWVITADAFAESSTVQRFFIAISTTSDPTGSFLIYRVNSSQFTGTNNFL